MARPRKRKPNEQTEPLAKYTVTITYKQARLALRAGGGNRSEGMRAAWDYLEQDERFWLALEQERKEQK